MFYPLQTCHSICDVVVMVMSAIACLNPAYFQYLTTANRERNRQFTNAFLQKPTRYSKYLHLVVGSWTTQNSLRISYVTPVRLEETSSARLSMEKPSLVDEVLESLQTEEINDGNQIIVKSPTEKKIVPEILNESPSKENRHSPRSKK